MAIDTMSTTIQDLAKDALQLQAESARICKQLEDKKEELRKVADGQTVEIIVKGEGKVNITAPRAGSQEKFLKVNMDLLQVNVELKKKLMEKNILTEETKVISAAKASVTIKPNV